MALAKIVFASMTGNTEEIADIVADKLRDLGLDVDVDECTTVDASDFLEADIAIVATYTYGDGELPDEMMDFYEDLADLNLNGKISLFIAFIIDTRTIRCITNNSKSTLVVTILYSIHFCHPSQSRFIITNSFDGLFWKMVIEQGFQTYLTSQGIRVRFHMTMNDDGIVFFDFL